MSEEEKQEDPSSKISDAPTSPASPHNRWWEFWSSESKEFPSRLTGSSFYFDPIRSFHQQPDPQRRLFGESFFINPALRPFFHPHEPETATEAEYALQKLVLRINEVVAEAALTWERIAKDQQAVEQLKNDTRALLRRMRG